MNFLGLSICAEQSSWRFTAGQPLLTKTLRKLSAAERDIETKLKLPRFHDDQLQNLSMARHCATWRLITNTADMRREDAEQLTNHYYRLYTSIKPVVDTSPPTSFYSSPKSTFYRPFAMRKPIGSSNSQKLTRHKGREELAQFLALRRTRSHSQLGFNSFARSRPESCLSSTELNRPNVRSKLLDLRDYQPPSRLRLHSGNSPTSSSAMNSANSSPLPPKPSRTANKELENRRRVNHLRIFSDVYDQFKDRVLSEILLRNVFTNRVIEDCFRREIDKHPQLQREVLLDIMSETMAELGISDRRRAKSSTAKHVTIAEEAKHKMSLASLTSSSQTTPPVQTSGLNVAKVSDAKHSVKAPKQELYRMLGDGLNFRIDASPPSTISSLSADIDNLVRCRSHSESIDMPNHGHSLGSFESETEESSFEDDLSSVIERAKQKT